MSDAVMEVRHEVPIARACQDLALSRATLYRPERPTRPAPTTLRKVPRKLSDAERAAIVEVLHREEFVDQPPGEIVATLLSRGEYVGSVRTLYRVLAAMEEVRERRAQRRHPPAHKPSLTVHAPNQVWTWDITKVAMVGSKWLYVYVLLDLFSRYVVGWLVAEREQGAIAAAWLRETTAQHGVDASKLIVHNDRGSPMTSVSFTKLCVQLGIAQSFSRPHVSDDNPFSEAHFKTMKYQPDFPGRFDSPAHAREWMSEFFTWHNEHHHHEGLAMFTPATVFYGRVEEVAERRQRALDAAYRAHPERFVKGAPRVRRPPVEVSINPAVAVEQDACTAHPEPAETSPKASHRPVDREAHPPSRAAEIQGAGGSTRAAAGRTALEASSGVPRPGAKRARRHARDNDGADREPQHTRGATSLN